MQAAEIGLDAMVTSTTLESNMSDLEKEHFQFSNALTLLLSPLNVGYKALGGRLHTLVR